jgi:hypothetical protein
VLGVALVDRYVAFIVIFMLFDLHAAEEGVVGIVAAAEAVIQVAEDGEVVTEMLDRLE